VGFTASAIPPHLVDNIKREPFEKAVGLSQDSATSVGGALVAPMSAFIYDWNMLSVGQQLWLKWFETLKEFPPLQAPESYNLVVGFDRFVSFVHLPLVDQKRLRSRRVCQHHPVSSCTKYTTAQSAPFAPVSLISRR
jgi:hypothetical protein